MTLFFSIPQNPEEIITLTFKTTFLYYFPSCEDMGECQPSLFPASELSMEYTQALFSYYILAFYFFLFEGWYYKYLKYL